MAAPKGNKYALGGSGRPSTLNDDLIAIARQYIEKPDGLPTIERLARKMNISRETLYVWAKENQVISDILEDLRQDQADQLIQDGLVGKYNATITKLMLSKHGYVDQKDITTNGKDMPAPILGGMSKDA